MGFIVFTRAEAEALAAYVEAERSRSRTFRVQRDSRNVLYVLEQDGRLTQLTPDREAA